MTNAELLAKIREEIERRRSLLTQHSKLTYDLILETFIKEYDDLLSFLDTLEESEEYTGKYNEAYLNDKIKKASEHWKGVDMDKYMSEVRGEEPVREELEEAAEKYAYNGTSDEWRSRLKPIADEIIKNFIAGANWQKEHDAKLIEIAYNDGIIIGMTKQKEQMMKEAVEGKVFMSFAPGHNQMVMADVDLPTNTKVRIIIVKE